MGTVGESPERSSHFRLIGGLGTKTASPELSGLLFVTMIISFRLYINFSYLLFSTYINRIPLRKVQKYQVENSLSPCGEGLFV